MKKVISFVLIFAMLLPGFSRVSAASIPAADEKTGLPLSLAAYSDAYIEFSEKVFAKGIAPMLCIEDFVENFEGGNFRSIDEYIDLCLKQEVKYAAANPIPANYGEIPEELLLAEMGANAGTRASVVERWYDKLNVTSGGILLGSGADYSRYNLLNTVQKGDIIQETDGLVSRITGHIAIVQGKYIIPGTQLYYIRTIESNLHGVVYGALDADRVDERGAKVFYVTSATSTQKSGAVSFCLNQLGKPYNTDGLVGGVPYCNYLASSSKWYCSELVWAAYYSQNINLFSNDMSVIPPNIYLPRNLASSAKLTRRSIS